MHRRGSVNRRTGKTMPRLKRKTHWSVNGSTVRTPHSGKPGKSGAFSSKSSTKAAP